MKEQKPLILIVEDDKDMAEFNTRLLKRHGYDTVVAHTLAQARELFREHVPDLMVQDVKLPDGDGRELCAEFRKKSDIPVIFLTGKTKTEDRIKGLDAGGDYYLTKPHDSGEFIAVVKSQLRKAEQGKTRLNESTLIKRGPIVLTIPERKAAVYGHDAKLTQKEFAIFLILVQNEGKEVTYDAIYEQVWSAPMNNDSSAIRQHISRLKRKLGEEDTDDFAILNERGTGYTFTTK